MWDPIATVSWRFQIPHVAQAQYCFFWGTRNKGTAGEWELILIILLRNPQPCYDWTVLRALQQPQPYAGSGVQPQLTCGEWCATSAPMRGVVRKLSSHAGSGAQPQIPCGELADGQDFPDAFQFPRFKIKCCTNTNCRLPEKRNERFRRKRTKHNTSDFCTQVGVGCPGNIHTRISRATQCHLRRYYQM